MLRHIGKCAITVVVIEMAGGGLVLTRNNRRTIRQVNVRPAIVVVVEDHCTVTRGLDDEFLVGIVSIRVECIDSCCGSYVLKMNFARSDLGDVPNGLIGTRCKVCGQQKKSGKQATSKSIH